MKLKKRISAFLLAGAMMLMLAMEASAFDYADTITEKEVLDQINNGSAVVENEVRDVYSYTQEEIESDGGLTNLFAQLDGMSTRSVNTGSKQGSIYTTTVITSSGDKVVYRSVPTVTISVTDVGTAGSSDINSRLKIASSITVNGVANTSWDNYIRYKNICVNMGCGSNTAFTRSIRVSGNSSAGSGSDMKAIIGWIANTAGYSTVAQIVSAFPSISYPNSTYVQSKAVSESNVRAVGLKCKPTIMNNGDYLYAESSLSTVKSSLTANASANSVAKWSFDIYYGIGATRPEKSGQTIQVSRSYIVNVK